MCIYRAYFNPPSMFGTSIVQAVQSSKYLLETLKAHCTDLSCSHVEGKTAEASGKISYTGVQPRHLVFEHSLGVTKSYCWHRGC